MTSTEILEQLHDLGITVRLSGPNVRMEPGNRVPPVLIDEVRQHKSEIIFAISHRYGDGQPLPLNRPPETEQELRRWMDFTADPKRFAERFDWAMTTCDPAEDPQ